MRTFLSFIALSLLAVVNAAQIDVTVGANSTVKLFYPDRRYVMTFCLSSLLINRRL